MGIVWRTEKNFRCCFSGAVHSFCLVGFETGSLAGPELCNSLSRLGCLATEPLGSIRLLQASGIAVSFCLSPEDQIQVLSLTRSSLLLTEPCLQPSPL